MPRHPIRGRGSAYRQRSEPMGRRRRARRLPAEQLAAAGELPGRAAAEPGRGGLLSAGPGRAAAAMAKGAGARRGEAAGWGWWRGLRGAGQGGARGSRRLWGGRGAEAPPGRCRRDSSPARCAQLAGKGLGRRGSACREQRAL